MSGDTDGVPSEPSSDSDGTLAGSAGDSDRILTTGNRWGRRIPDLVVSGIPEREIWAQAPPMVCDRVYWDTEDHLDVTALIPQLPGPAWTRAWSDGQHRVWVPEGQGTQAREAVRELCAERGLEAFNLRVESGVPFRDLNLIDPALRADLFAAAVEWLYPRMLQVRRRLVGELDLTDDDDVRQMMFLFVSDMADRYDTEREGRNGSLNFLTYLMGKMRTWPQDLARAAYGRTALADRVAMNRAADAVMSASGHKPSEAELAAQMGITITELRRREQAVATLSSFRNYASLSEDPLDGPGPAVAVDDADVESEALDYARNAALTRAVMAAVHDPEAKGRRAQDPLALAALYLTYWEGLSRSEVARELGVLPKTVSAAASRTLGSIDAGDLR